MKNYALFTTAALLALSFMPGRCRADIDTGLDIRGRAYEMSNPTYADAGSPRNYFDQRTRFYLKGLLKKDVSAEMTLQNNGLWGREGEEQMFFERANVRADNIFSLPASITLGRQGCKLGEGLIINDDNNGLSGVRLDSGLPLGFSISAAAFKLVEASSKTFSAGESDRDIYFASLGRNIFNGRADVTYFSDVNKSSAAPVQNSLIDLRYKTSASADVLWTWEYAQNIGVKAGAKTSAFLARVTAFGDIGTIGRGDGFLVYAKGKDGFKTPTSYLNEYGGFGEYYMKNRESGRSNSIENLQLQGGGLKARLRFMPVDVFFNYFDYNLAAADVSGETKLGNEKDLGALYSYTDNLKFRFVYSIFAPGAAVTSGKSKNNQILLETNLFF